MRAFIWTSIAILLLPMAVLAQAPPEKPAPAQSDASGWSRVRDLANGDEITVKDFRAGTIHCLFDGATTDFLFCNPAYGFPGGEGFRFDRAAIFNVRVSHEKRNRGLIIGTVAAAGFVAIFVSHKSAAVAPARVADSFVGAGAGALLGTMVALPVTPFIPGDPIYRQSPPDAKARTRTPPPQPAYDPAHPSRLAP